MTEPEDQDSPSLDDLVEQVHAELRATEELPVEREASRWVGEAQAVAADVAGGDLAAHVVRERVARVRELLDHVDGTGHDEADEHVERARELAQTATEER